MICISAEVQPIADAATRASLVSKTVTSPTKYKTPVHDPKIHPEVVARWNGLQWEFSFDDKNKIEITPRQRNLLVQHIQIFLRRKFRANRVKARASAPKIGG